MASFLRSLLLLGLPGFEAPLNSGQRQTMLARVRNVPDRKYRMQWRVPSSVVGV